MTIENSYTNYNYILVPFYPPKVYGNPQVVFLLSAPIELVAAVINSLTSSNVLHCLLANFLLSIAQIFSVGFSSGLCGGKKSGRYYLEFLTSLLCGMPHYPIPLL